MTTVTLTPRSAIGVSLTARQLYDLAPFGAVVAFSNNQPKPPAHHKKKLQHWQYENSKGRFEKTEAGTTIGNVTLEPGFTLLRHESTIIKMYCTYSALSLKYTYSIISVPEPGSIIRWTKYGDNKELQEIYSSLEAFREKSQREKHYTPQFYWMVMSDGTMQDFAFEQLQAAE